MIFLTISAMSKSRPPSPSHSLRRDSKGASDRSVPMVNARNTPWSLRCAGRPSHNPARDLLAVLSAAEEDPLRLEHRNVRRMRHNPVERAQTPIQVAGHRVKIGDAVQTAVEFGKAGASFGDVARPSLAGAVPCRHDRGDSRAGAQIQETAAFAQRDMLQKQAGVGDKRRVDHVAGSVEGGVAGVTPAVRSDVQIRQRVERHGAVAPATGGVNRQQAHAAQQLHAVAAHQALGLFHQNKLASQEKRR